MADDNIIQQQIDELTAQKDALQDKSSSEARKIRKKIRTLKKKLSSPPTSDTKNTSRTVAKKRSPRKKRTTKDEPVVPAIDREEFLNQVAELNLDRQDQIRDMMAFTWVFSVLLETGTTPQQLYTRFKDLYGEQPAWYTILPFGDSGLFGLGPIPNRYNSLQ